MRHSTFAVRLVAATMLAACSPNPPPPVTGACPKTTTGPTEHGGTLSASETWKAAASPHVITRNLTLGDGVTLTVERCSEVRLAAGVRLVVNGAGATLVAEGDADHAITFRRDGADPWGNVLVDDPGRARLAYVTLEGGGGRQSGDAGATLILSGPTPPPAAPVLKADHLTLTGSAGYGMMVRHLAAFAEGSAALTITGSGATDAAHPDPVLLPVQVAGTLPQGTYTGNARDAVALVTSDPLEADLRLDDPGVPYRVGTAGGTLLVWAPTVGGPAPTLTLGPGVTLQMPAKVTLKIGSSTQAGHLVTLGTQAAPVRFERGDADPWGFVRTQSPGTISLDWTTLDGGGENVLTYAGASLIADGDDAEPLEPLLATRHVTVRNSAGHGVMVRAFATFSADSTDLTITGCGADSGAPPYPLRIDAESAGTLPDGTYTGNAADAIVIDSNQGLHQSLTLTDHGVPYRLTSLLSVDRGIDPTRPMPTLTLEAGTELQFPAGSRLRVGYTGGGHLQVNGGAGQVVLTSAEAAPAPGDWVGVQLIHDAALGSHLLTGVRIAYAGGDSSSEGYDCYDGNPEDGALLIQGWRPDASILVNSEIVASGGNGVVRGWSSDSSGPDFTSGNTIEAAPGFAQQTTPKHADGTCP